MPPQLLAGKSVRVGHLRWRADGNLHSKTQSVKPAESPVGPADKPVGFGVAARRPRSRAGLESDRGLC